VVDEDVVDGGMGRMKEEVVLMRRRMVRRMVDLWRWWWEWWCRDGCD